MIVKDIPVIAKDISVIAKDISVIAKEISRLLIILKHINDDIINIVFVPEMFAL